MHFSYFVQQKLKLASALVIILVIVLINNRWENKKIHELGETFGSVYKDRLVVENYIFKLATATHEKKYLLTQYNNKQEPDIKNKIQSINNKIDFLITDYQKTYLTVAEKGVFKNFLENNRQLRAIEESSKLEIAQLNGLYEKNIKMLNELSNIQMKEGEALYENSRSIVTSNANISYLELGLLIILGLISQALLFNSKSINRMLKKDVNNLPLN